MILISTKHLKNLSAELPQKKKCFVLLLFRVLTASIPESCMPMLMTTTVSTCQRTDSSINSLKTDRVSTDDKERCSSCISSISAWMLHLALYHFRAESQRVEICRITRSVTTTDLQSKVGGKKKSISVSKWKKNDPLICVFL